MSQNIVRYGSYSLDTAKAEEGELAASGSDFMKLEVGKTQVRFLPPPIGRSSPFVIAHQHFVQLPGMSSPASFNCPRAMAKKACAVCAKVDELRSSGNPADYDLAGSYLPRFRVYSVVIDRKRPEVGPRVLPFGKSVHKELIKIRSDDAAGGDFCDPVGGFDIVIDRVGTGKTDTEYSVRAARTSTKLAESVEQMNDWIEAQPNVLKYASVPTADDIRKILSLQPSQDRASSPRGQHGSPPARAPKARTAQDDLDASDDEIPS